MEVLEKVTEGINVENSYLKLDASGEILWDTAIVDGYKARANVYFGEEKERKTVVVVVAAVAVVVAAMAIIIIVVVVIIVALIVVVVVAVFE
jgi:hypothetical protein